MAAELISFGTGAKWVQKLGKVLWGRLTKYKSELEAINNIIYGDPLDIARYYVEPECQDHNPADFEKEDYLVTKQPVMAKMDEFFRSKSDHPGDNQLFVLSDAGMGKTALLTMLKLMHLTAFWPKQTDCVLKKLGEGTLKEIGEITSKSRTILLLDSLDEDTRAYGRVRERLVDILQASRDFRKVVITCRTQFFPKVDEDPFRRPGMVAIDGFICPAKYLSFFSDEKVAAYLRNRFPRKLRLPDGIQRWLRRDYGEKWAFLTDQEKVQEGMEVVQKMGALKCRPMLLSYIDDLMESGFEKAELNEYQIYNALVKSWLRREHLKKKDISEEALFKASVILATILQIRERRSIGEAELKQLIGKIGEVMPIHEVDFKGRSLINRNSDGNYRFSHYSIQEFCVAKLLIETPPIFRPKGRIFVTDLILDFIRRTGSELNFPELLDVKNVKKLDDLPLNRILLDGISLKGKSLRNCDFSGMDLKGFDLSGADLTGANFNGSLLEGARFDWETEFSNELGMTFRFIPPGTFMMGSPENEPGRSDDEKRHQVKITAGFYLQTTPVTQGQWEAVMGNNPSEFKNAGPDAPVEQVSWNDVQEFVGKLNEKEGSEVYRLPTEAEWEYACRAGTETAFYSGPITEPSGRDPNLEKVGWYGKNTGSTTHPVGQKEPNAWGLYDMHGNVWEWCQDWYGDYPDVPVTDPTGPESGAYRVDRGGAWDGDAGYCRAAYRSSHAPVSRSSRLGFRLLAERRLAQVR